MELILNAFVRNHLQADYVGEVPWGVVQSQVLAARRVLANPAKYPRADFEYLEKVDLELTCFLLKAPVQYLV